MFTPRICSAPPQVSDWLIWGHWRIKKTEVLNTECSLRELIRADLLQRKDNRIDLTLLNSVPGDLITKRIHDQHLEWCRGYIRYSNYIVKKYKDSVLEIWN
jgi:hypothetical protein